MLPNGRQGRVMRLITSMSKGMLILSILAKVGGGTEGKEGHGFLETPLVVHPLLGIGVLLRKQSKFLTFYHNKSVMRK